MIIEWRAVLHVLIICSCLLGVLAGTKRSSCNKIACPKTREYVCGSDGKTYRNECQLQKRACKGPHIDIAHEGRCGTASSKHELVMEGFEWGLASKRVPRGSPSVIILNVSAILEDNGGRVNGINLWRLGVFGSKWNDGWGKRKNEVRQILTPFQQNRPARGGTPLNFVEVEGEFNYTTLGCDSFRYLCFELAKGDNAEPDFQLRTFTMQDSLIICEEVPCQRPGHHQTGNDGSPSCAISCPYDYAPVCGTDGQTYPNSCEIENQIRCSPGSSLEIVFEDACDAGVTIASIFWSVEATNFVSRGPSELLLDVIVITEGTLDVSGTDLWRMGLFGSQNVDGSGPRLGYQYQILNSTQADMSLAAVLPINLHFLIPVEFNVGKIGCSRYKFFCVEFSKGNNATPDFPFRSSSGKAIFVGCRSAPCNGPESDGTGRLTASIGTFGWGLRASGSARPGEPSNVRLTVSVPVLHDSDEIQGRNLWRVGLYGNRQSDGSDNERFSYVRQTITDQQVNSSLIPGTNMEFTIDTQFVITGVGCGGYAYLCVEFAQADNPEPDFIFNPDHGGEAIVICQRVPCRDENSNSGNPNRGSGRRSVARLANLNWNLKINNLNFDSPSNVTLQVTVIPDDSTDSIAGEGLWRLGIFFSTQPNGQGDRHKYDSQILPEVYADWPLAPQRPMIFLDVYTPIDVTSLGCNRWRYICVEFAKGVNPRPDFDLPLPRGMEAAVSCRSFPCTNGGGDINPGGHGGAGGPPDYNPNNPQGDGTGPEIPSASVSTIRISNFHAAPDRVQFLLAITPGPYSQRIGGEGLWRIALYGSRDRNGQQVGIPHNRQVLNVRSQGKSLRPPSQLVFDVDTNFEMYQLGCGQLRYICIEFGKGDRPVPDFNLILPGGDTVVTCQMVPCNTPNLRPYNPNNNQPAPNPPDNSNGGGGLGPRYFAYLTGLFWTMQPIIIRNDARSLIRLRVTAPVSNTSDTINGRGLWRVALFGSPDSVGSEPHFDYHHQILRQEDQNEAAIPYYNLSFNAITDFDLMGIGCADYRYLCIEFAKGDSPVPDFYFPLSGGAGSIISCQRAKCMNPNAVQLQTTVEPQYQGTAHLARFGWEMNPLRKNPDGPSDVSFTLTITPQLSTDIISGTGLWRVGVFGSQRETGDEPRTSYKRQVLNQLQTDQPLKKGPLSFDVQTTMDMREMGCGPYKFLCIEFAKGDNPQPDFRMPLNSRDSLISCQNVPCLNTKRPRPRPRPHPNPVSRPPPPPQPNQGTEITPTRRPSPEPPQQPTSRATTIRPTHAPTESPYYRLWPTMSKPKPTHRPRPQQPVEKPRPRPRPRPPQPPQSRPYTNQPEQEDQPTNNPVKIGDNQLGYLSKPSSSSQPQRQLPYSEPQPVSPNIQETYPDEPRRRYVPIPGRKVVWFSAIRWKASVEKVFQDGSQEINLDVMLIPHNNRVNAVMGRGLWRMGIFGSTNAQGTGPKHDYKHQILIPFDQSNPLIPPNFLQFDVDTEFDIKSVGCGRYKYVCLEFDKAEQPSIEFDLVVEDGVLGPIVSCQAAPCSSTSTFLTTRGPPPDVRPHVIIRNVRPEQVTITEEAQNQLDIDVEIVYDQRSDEVTGTNLWRLELWTSPKPDGSGTRLVSLDQALTDVQSGKALVRPYPFAFTNIRMNLDMRGNRCSYARYVCARLSNDPFRHLEPSFDLTAEPNYQALTGCTKTQCHRAHGVSAHPSSRPLVKFTGITVGIPTIEENIVNKLALRVNVHVSPESESVSGSQLWTLNVWGSRKANGGGTRYSNIEQALIPQQADMSVIPPTDLLFEYVRFDLDMSRAGCNDITYICVAISTQSTNFDLQGVPNESSLQGCTTVTCQTATVPELVVNSVSIILPPTPVISGQSNPMTMDLEVVYDVSNSAAINGNNNWRVKVWGSDRANGGGPRISQANQALTRQQAAQPLILGRPFTIRGIEYSMNLRTSYCRDVSFVCAQLVAGNNSFKLRPIPNKKSLISCQRIHCING